MSMLPETVYASFVGAIEQPGIYRIINGLCNATQHGAKEVHLALQSSGGLISDGIALYNFLRGFPLDLHVYNIGAVQSIAVHAYLGAKNRYVSAQGTFMMHKAHFSPEPGVTASRLQRLAERLTAEDDRIETILRAHTNIPDGIWALHASQDIHFDAADALKFGIATLKREWQVPAGSQIFNL